MQNKLINFGNWVSDLIEKYMPDCPEKTLSKNLTSGYFKEEPQYLAFMFTMVPGVCGIPKAKASIHNLRQLKHEDKRIEAIQHTKAKALYAKAIIDMFLAIPEDELDAIVKKFSLYINMVTDMYFQ